MPFHSWSVPGQEARARPRTPRGGCRRRRRSPARTARPSGTTRVDVEHARQHRIGWLATMPTERPAQARKPRHHDVGRRSAGWISKNSAVVDDVPDRPGGCRMACSGSSRARSSSSAAVRPVRRSSVVGPTRGRVLAGCSAAGSPAGARGCRPRCRAARRWRNARVATRPSLRRVRAIGAAQLLLNVTSSFGDRLDHVRVRSQTCSSCSRDHEYEVGDGWAVVQRRAGTRPPGRPRSAGTTPDGLERVLQEDVGVARRAPPTPSWMRARRPSR